MKTRKPAASGLVRENESDYAGDSILGHLLPIQPAAARMLSIDYL